jgi:hypothetical protein
VAAVLTDVVGTQHADGILRHSPVADHPVQELPDGLQIKIAGLGRPPFLSEFSDEPLHARARYFTRITVAAARDDSTAAMQHLAHVLRRGPFGPQKSLELHEMLFKGVPVVLVQRDGQAGRVLGVILKESLRYAFGDPYALTYDSGHVLPFVAEADTEALELPADDHRREAIALVNPLSKEESVLRTTLLPGLLRAVRRNVNRQVGDVAVFEVGHCFLPPDEADPGAPAEPPHADAGGVVLPAEPLMLGFAACGEFEAARHDRHGRPADPYDLLGAADLVRRALGRSPLEAVATDERPFHPGRAARLRLDGRDIGAVGELHPRIAAAFEVPKRTLVGELRLDRLVADGVQAATPETPSPLPGARFDVAVVVAEDVPAAAVEAAVRTGAGDRLTECRLFDVFRGEQVGAGRKSLAYALRIDDPEQQLTDDDVTAAIEQIAAAVARRVGGQLRRS